MTPRLGRDEVTHHVGTLRERSSLTALQAARLDAIVGTLGDGGRFRLRDALVAAEFPDGDARGQEAFQDFRKRINAAAADAGIDLQLELDSRKARPDDRYGWFTGGDLVDEGIASYTGAAASRTGIVHPVAPEVTELGPATGIRVYVSAEPDRHTTALLAQLRTELQLDGERNWDVTDVGSVGLGEDPDATRDRLSARADVRIALVSSAYLAGDERRRALDRPGRTIAFAVSRFPDGPLDLGRLGRHDIHRRDAPWDELTRTGQRRRYVSELADAVRRELQRPSPIGGTADESLEAWTSERAWHRRAGESAVAVPQDAAETSLRESRLDGVATAAGPAQPAVARLVGWATGDGPGLCALLGDVGMGKTTTAKLFTQRLLELRAAGEQCPLPLLFDLRDVRIDELRTGSVTLDRILDGMLDATRPPDVPSSRLDSGVVRRRLARGDVVVVFDGLDEVLVHLGQHEQRLFTRQLWRAAEDGARMLVTCRTQYFRTIRDEIGYLTGEDRQGLRGEHYLALLMQPFREEQVREYLQSNVDRDGDWVDGFLETVAAVHDLTDLSQRPLTLRLIADQVEFIETAKLADRQIRSVDLYGEVVDRWLSRDGGKHTLLPEHKRLLMEEIAAGLWRSGRSSWNPDEVDSWLLDLLDRRPDLQRHYRERVPDLWKADFRTATFLARDRGDDTFAFGHRSLFEYFLARYLLRTLRDLGTTPERDMSALAMAVPSGETLEFLGQSIAGLPEPERAAVLAGLERTRDTYVAGVSELALAYAVRAVGHGYPRHRLDGVRLGGAALGGVEIGRADGPQLSLAGADLAGADLSGAVLHGVDLTGADLTGTDLTRAELHKCRLDSARLHGSRMAGTVLRRCSLSGVRLDDAATHRTQVLFCDPAPETSDGLLVAPSVAGTDGAGALRVLTGHTGIVRTAAWSPDGTRILTGGHGGARICDARTHEPLATLDAHGGEVFATAWSPDGTRVLTGSGDGVRMWEVATLAVVWHAADESEGIRSIAWAPDGTRILVGGRDTVHIQDAAAGRVLRVFDGGADVVGWSPDGARLFAAGEDGLRVWDASGSPGPAVVDGSVSDAAWSPDGTRILCGDSGGVVTIRDAATGAPQHQFRAGDDGDDEDRPGVQAVVWSPDGEHVLACEWMGIVRLWDVGAAAVPRVLVRTLGRVDSLSWSPAGERILVTGSAGALIWDGLDGRLVGQLPGHAAAVESLAWSEEGEHLLVHHLDVVRGLDLTDGGTTTRITTTMGGTETRFAWSPGTARMVSADNDGGVRVRDTSTGAVLLRLDVSGILANVAWSADGSRILVTRPDGLREFDAATGELRREIPEIPYLLPGSWSPDRSRILHATPDTLQILDAATGDVVGDLPGSSGFTDSVGWSPDGSRIVTADSDGILQIWDARDRIELIRLARHGGSVYDVAWSGDGRWIASGGDGCVLVHDAESGAPVHHITGHSDWVGALAWSADSTRLACGGDDGRIQIVDVTTGRTIGLRFVMLPGEEMAVFDTATDALVGASPDAWRWLGWTTVRDGAVTRLPAETFGPLPALPEARSSAGTSSRSLFR